MSSANVGLWVRVIPLWNETSRGERQIQGEVRVEMVRRGRGCQSGEMWLVKNDGGEKVWLDKGWFHGTRT